LNIIGTFQVPIIAILSFKTYKQFCFYANVHRLYLEHPNFVFVFDETFLSLSKLFFINDVIRQKTEIYLYSAFVCKQGEDNYDVLELMLQENVNLL